MSEPLWDDKKIDDVAMDALGGYGTMTLFAAKRAMHQICDEYDAKIAELEAQLATRDEWEMLPDGLYPTAHTKDSIEVEGEWLTVTETPIEEQDEKRVTVVELPDDMRMFGRKAKETTL